MVCRWEVQNIPYCFYTTQAAALNINVKNPYKDICFFLNKNLKLQNITLNNKMIEHNEHLKILGVYIQDNLKWKKAQKK